jgi:hypothetical protein
VQAGPGGPGRGPDGPGGSGPAGVASVPGRAGGVVAAAAVPVPPVQAKPAEPPVSAPPPLLGEIPSPIADDLTPLDQAPDLTIEKDPSQIGVISGEREIRSRRAEVGVDFDQARRFKMLTMMLIVLAILGAPLTVYIMREATRDPVFVGLDALELPAEMSLSPQDTANGSRWCINECRFRQRVYQSEQNPDPTHAAYEKALRAAGWLPWKIAGCPAGEIVGTKESCWQRDEYVLDLWVHQERCEVDLDAPGQDQPGANPNAKVDCPKTEVSLKVINRIAFRPPAGGA